MFGELLFGVACAFGFHISMEKVHLLFGFVRRLAQVHFLGRASGHGAGCFSRERSEVGFGE